MTVPDTLPPELAELGDLLREDPPRAAGDWTRRLDERVAAGFPVPAGEAGRVPRAVRRARRERGRRFAALRPAFAPVAVVLLLGVVIAVPVALNAGPGGGSDDAGSGASPGGGGATALSESRDSAESAGGGGAASGPEPALKQDSRDAILPVPPVPGGGSPGSDARRARKVERSAAITLGAPAREVGDVADGVVRVTDSVGGFVANSSVYSAAGSEAHATFELRIPTARLPRALADLSRLAHVRERSQSAADITAQAVSAADRLQEARKERQSLLRQLGRAVTLNETESIKARLRLVNRRIAAARASVRRVSNRANFANVSVSVVADAGSGAAPGGSWTPRDAFGDAVRVLEVAAGVFLIAMALLIPLALVAGLGWLAGRVAVRRRRERALDVA
jgi:hypothetical protein